MKLVGAANDMASSAHLAGYVVAVLRKSEPKGTQAIFLFSLLETEGPLQHMKPLFFLNFTQYVDVLTDILDLLYDMWVQIYST